MKVPQTNGIYTDRFTKFAKLTLLQAGDTSLDFKADDTSLDFLKAVFLLGRFWNTLPYIILNVVARLVDK